MDFSSTPDSTPRIRVSALFSAAEAEALQTLLKNLTTEDYQRLAGSSENASVFAAAANKMSRQINAAEQLPVMPAFDD